MSSEDQVKELVAAIERQTKSINALVECNTKLMTALIEIQMGDENLDEDSFQFDLSGNPIR